MFRRKDSAPPDLEAPLYPGPRHGDPQENPIEGAGDGPQVLWYFHGEIKDHDPFAQPLQTGTYYWVHDDGSELEHIETVVEPDHTLCQPVIDAGGECDCRPITKVREMLGAVHRACEQFSGTGIGIDGRPYDGRNGPEAMNFDPDFALPGDDLVIMPESVTEIGIGGPTPLSLEILIMQTGIGDPMLPPYWGGPLNRLMALSNLLLLRDGYTEDGQHVFHRGSARSWKK